jgi:hypothetical protein
MAMRVGSDQLTGSPSLAEVEKWTVDQVAEYLNQVSGSYTCLLFTVQWFIKYK